MIGRYQNAELLFAYHAYILFSGIPTSKFLPGRVCHRAGTWVPGYFSQAYPISSMNMTFYPPPKKNGNNWNKKMLSSQPWFVILSNHGNLQGVQYWSILDWPIYQKKKKKKKALPIEVVGFPGFLCKIEPWQVCQVFWTCFHMDGQKNPHKHLKFRFYCHLSLDIEKKIVK